MYATFRLKPEELNEDFLKHIKQLFFGKKVVITVKEIKIMKLKYTYEMDGGFFAGYLDDYPEHPTQGETVKDFEENLLDIYHMIQSGELEVKKHGVVELAE